jgi:hypothetical protein
MRTQNQSMHGSPKDEARLARLLESALTSAQRQSLPGVVGAVVFGPRNGRILTAMSSNFLAAKGNYCRPRCVRKPC